MSEVAEQPKKFSLVLYTDGGSRWHLGGIGIHGYIFDDAISKTYHGHKGYIATKKGYQLKSNSTIPVNVIQYVDFTCSVPNCTNNMAETMAMVEALKFILANDVADVIFLLDSEYTLKGINEWMAGWKRNHWCKNDGEEISNKNVWMKIDELMEELRSRNIRLQWHWVKGHSNDLGNDRADMLATQAIFSLRKHQLKTHSTQGIGSSIGQWKLSNPKGYWVPNISYNRLLCQPRIFINTDIYQLASEQPPKDYGAKYFMANIGADDALFGKPSPRGSYAVLLTKEPDPVADLLFNAHFEARHYMAANLPIHISPMALLRMHEVLKPSTYFDILTNGSKNILPLKDRADLYDVHMNNLTYELRTSLAYDGQAILMELDTILKTYLSSTDEERLAAGFVFNEFFDEFYERTESPKKTITKLKETIGEEGFLDLPCQYQQTPEEGLKTTNLRLVIGVDIPTRNTLAALTDNIVSLGILTWVYPAVQNALRYGFFIKTTTDVMFWAAHYSNAKIINNPK